MPYKITAEMRPGGRLRPVQSNPPAWHLGDEGELPTPISTDSVGRALAHIDEAYPGKVFRFFAERVPYRR